MSRLITAKKQEPQLQGYRGVTPRMHPPEVSFSQKSQECSGLNTFLQKGGEREKSRKRFLWERRRETRGEGEERERQTTGRYVSDSGGVCGGGGCGLGLQG